MHQKGFIHRDLKPENILLDDQYHVKVCDFGWCTEYEQEDEMRKTFCGTYEYMAPEIFEKSPYDEKVDIWALGILLYELVHGKSPFRGNSVIEIYKNVQRGDIRFGSHCGPEVKDLVSKILKKMPSARYSMDQILAHDLFKKYPSKEREREGSAMSKGNYGESKPPSRSVQHADSSLDKGGSSNGGQTQGQISQNPGAAHSQKSDNKPNTASQASPMPTNLQSSRLASALQVDNSHSQSKRNLQTTLTPVNQQTANFHHLDGRANSITKEANHSTAQTQPREDASLTRVKRVPVSQVTIDPLGSNPDVHTFRTYSYSVLSITDSNTSHQPAASNLKKMVVPIANYSPKVNGFQNYFLSKGTNLNSNSVDESHNLSQLYNKGVNNKSVDKDHTGGEDGWDGNNNHRQKKSGLSSFVQNISITKESSIVAKHGSQLPVGTATFGAAQSGNMPVHHGQNQIKQHGYSDSQSSGNRL